MHVWHITCICCCSPHRFHIITTIETILSASIFDMPSFIICSNTIQNRWNRNWVFDQQFVLLSFLRLSDFLTLLNNILDGSLSLTLRVTHFLHSWECLMHWLTLLVIVFTSKSLITFVWPVCTCTILSYCKPGTDLKNALFK